MHKTQYLGEKKAALSGWRKVLIGLLILVFTWHFGHAVYIYAKAQLAQVLIAQAWEQQLETGEAVSPWPWADTFPIAKMTFPAHNKQLYALAAGTDAIIAFGPGHIAHSAAPGRPGNSVFVGHNDTHFNFLKDVKRGDLIEIATAERTFVYQLDAIRIAHQTEVGALDFKDSTLSPERAFEETRLTLITCYPFDSVAANTDYRYLVKGTLVNSLYF